MWAKARVPEKTPMGCLKREKLVTWTLMRDLKEAVAKIATQAWCESLSGLEGGKVPSTAEARYPFRNLSG